MLWGLSNLSGDGPSDSRLLMGIFDGLFFRSGLPFRLPLEFLRCGVEPVATGILLTTVLIMALS